MERARRLQIRQLGPELTCHLCHGYFVDAFTVVECLHSFCKSCIMEHVKTSCECPTCGTQLNKARLTSALRPDQTLQSVVYKLVPRLFNDEMQRRRDFYQDHPHRDRSLSPERRGDVSSQQTVHTLTDPVSFSLQFGRRSSEDGKTKIPAIRYFQAPAGLGISHLKKLLHLKHGLGCDGIQIDILYGGDVLSDELIIMDVAYMYGWDRTAPMRFSYRCTTKRLLGVAPESAASPSKRRCPAPESGADSDKENVENDARPTETTDGPPPAAAALVPAEKPAERPARRPAPAAAVHEAPREPMTSPVTSPLAEAGAAMPAGATELKPAAGAGGDAGDAAVNRETAANREEGTPVVNGERTDVAKGERTALPREETRAVANGERNGATTARMASGDKSDGNVVASGEKLDGNLVASGEKTDGNVVASGDKSVGNLVASGKKSDGNVGMGEKDSDVLANRKDVNAASKQARHDGVVEKTTVAKRPTVSTNGEKHPRSSSAKDAVMVASGEMKHVDRQGIKRPPVQIHSAPQPIRPKIDAPKSSAASNGIRIGPKSFHSVQTHQKAAQIVPKPAVQTHRKVTQIAPKPPHASSNGGMTSMVSQLGIVPKPNKSSNALSQTVQSLPPKVTAADPVNGTTAQPQSIPKSSVPLNVLPIMTSSTSQTRPIASPGSSTLPSTQNPPTPTPGPVPLPPPTQNVGISNATPKHHTSTAYRAQKGSAATSNSGPSCATPRPGRAPSAQDGGGGDGTNPPAPPAPADDDRQCEDSGVDTDSSERPGTDSSRSPIDVYDFDAEAEDNAAVRLKTAPVMPSAVSGGRVTHGAPRSAAGSTADARQIVLGSRVTNPGQRLMQPGVVYAPSQRPVPPSTPACAVQRPAPPSTPGVSVAHRPLPPGSHPLPLQRPPPSGTPALPGLRPAFAGIPGVSPTQRPALSPGTPAQLLPMTLGNPSQSQSVPVSVAPAPHNAATSGSSVQRPTTTVPGTSPRRSLASLPELRPIGAGPAAIPLRTGQLDQFLRLVSRSAVPQPDGQWRLPTDASALLTRAAAPQTPVQPKPGQGKPADQARPFAKANTKAGHQKTMTAGKPMSQKAMTQKYRLSSTQGIQNLVTNEITITKIPNASRAGAGSGPAGGAATRGPPSAEPARSPGPAGRATADGSVTIEKIRAAPAPQSARPPNSPKLLAIAESLAMKKIQSQRPTAGKAPPAPVAAAPPSALSGLISLSQTQQYHKQQQQQQQRGLEVPRGRPAAGSSAHCQIPNPALLHHHSQGRLAGLQAPPAEAVSPTPASSSIPSQISAGTASGLLARMERLTNSLGR